MAALTVVKGVIEAWWSDITSLVTVSPTDQFGNPTTGPVRAPISVSFPATGGVSKSTAGAAAPDQTLSQFTSSGGVSIASGATVSLLTVAAGKTFYITDIFLTGNNATPTQFLVQIKQGTTVIWEGYLKTDTQPVIGPGIETQPQAPAGSAVTLVFPTSSGTTCAYFIGGFSQ